MEFHITPCESRCDPDAIEQAIRAVDPAALADIDPAGGTLRIAAALDTAQLLALLHQAGWPVTRDQVFQVPSICCGGCSG